MLHLLFYLNLSSVTTSPIDDPIGVSSLVPSISSSITANYQNAPSSKPSVAISSEYSADMSTSKSTLPTVTSSLPGYSNDVLSLFPSVSLSNTHSKNPSSFPIIATRDDNEEDCTFVKKHIFRNCEVSWDKVFGFHSSSSSKKGKSLQSMIVMTVTVLAYFCIPI